MADNSHIEWTDSTFNPWIGCTKVGPGCDHCYAEADFDHRKRRVKWGAGNPRSRTTAEYWKKPLRWEREHEQFFAEHGRRRRVFCASLADVFDNEVPAYWQADLFRLILKTPHLDWLLLTKRIGNAQRFLQSCDGAPSTDGKWTWPWPNVWLGITVVNQEEADRDIPKLLSTPVRVRFLSMEPLLGRVDLDCLKGTPKWPLNSLTGWYVDLLGRDQRGSKIDWVIAGGESGKDARPMHPDWARSLRDQCVTAGVPFFFKQWGEWVPGRPADQIEAGLWMHPNGNTFGPVEGEPFYPAPLSSHMVRVGKKAAGRLLDGREWNEFPEVAQ